MGYTMTDTMKVAKQASIEIEEYLRSLQDVKSVINVEDHWMFRELDIDLICELNGEVTTIEIKGDRQYHTGNYFFETVSNDDKGTEGCFMYTKADFLFYYFVDEGELHIFKIHPVREWFIENDVRFKSVRTQTSVMGESYGTWGRLVPRQEVVDNFEVKIIKIKRGDKE